MSHLQARLMKSFAASSESAAFALNLELSAAPGVTVLYGASGAGKSLTLDCLSGFIRPDSGRILLDDRILYDGAASVHLPTRERHCGYVSQNYALFPHMTLRQNLAFAAEGRPRLDRHRFINDMLERFRITAFAGRYPHQVSGGQKQRCSIARTLVSNPKLLLLDEPARGLEASLREDLYSILRELRNDYQIPILLVTHDLEECFATGDQLLIYQNGEIAQAGPPRKVLDRPANADVARILGYANIFEAEILALDPTRNSSRLRAFGQDLNGSYFPGKFLGDRLQICAQAGALHLHDQPGPNRVPAKLLRVSERTQKIRAEFSPGLIADLSPAAYDQHRDDKTLFLEIPPNALKAC